MSESQDYLIYASIQEYLQDYLNQMYMLDCLIKVSRQIVDNERAVKKAIEESDSFIDANSWINCAKQALARFDKHHTSQEELKDEIQETVSTQPLVEPSSTN